MNLLNFGAKNIGAKNNIAGAEANNNIIHSILDNADIAKKQILIYEEAKSYIEEIIEKDSIIKDIPTINNKSLSNYSIQFDNTNKYIHVKDKTNGFVYGTFSLGNKKLESNDNIQFLIFNVLQRVSCPNASSGCKKFCYANKTNCNVNCKNSSARNARLNNLILSMFSNFDSIVNEVIKFMTDYTKRKIIFRFHESGDIYSVIYWEKIKRIMYSNTNINFMFYTKTVFILDEINTVNKEKNISLRYSLDDTTPKAVIKKCYDINCLTFIVIDKNSTCKAIESVGNNFICNVKNIDVNPKLEAINKLEAEREAEHRKSYINKINTEINKINSSVIDTEKTCSRCMKCFNKNNIALFVATH